MNRSERIMKEKYIIPEVEMVVWEAIDVITSSTETELPWDEDINL